jgi:hypothetical protein
MWAQFLPVNKTQIYIRLDRIELYIQQHPVDRENHTIDNSNACINTIVQFRARSMSCMLPEHLAVSVQTLMSPPVGTYRMKRNVRA